MAMLTGRSWVKIALIALLCLLICGGLLGCSIGCSIAARHAGGLAQSLYRGASLAEQGDFSVPAAEVSSLELEWLAGGIDVVVDDELDGEVLVTGVEDLPGSMSDRNRMTWQLTDGVLQVSYGLEPSGFFGCTARGSKHLTLTLPRSVAQNLDVVGLTAASGTFDLGAIGCRQLDITLASGRVAGEGMKADVLDLDVASGNVSLKGRFTEQVSTSLASGNVDVQCTGMCPNQTSLDVVSGQLSFGVPADSGFTVYLDKLSGSFDCDLPNSRGSQHHDVWTYGDGRKSMAVDMTSGNVIVWGLDSER